jgi:type IV pilus assembly protein PilZ
MHSTLADMAAAADGCVGRADCADSRRPDYREQMHMATPTMGGTPRQGILSLAIKDKGALFNAYMPFVRGGGLFVPTAKPYNLGDEVFILLSLMDENDRLPVAGKVIWITPGGAQGNRMAGIGVQFNESSDGEVARTKIESILAGILTQERPTHTM